MGQTETGVNSLASQFQIVAHVPDGMIVGSEHQNGSTGEAPNPDIKGTLISQPESLP
jgi:hypothetical protein